MHGVCAAEGSKRFVVAFIIVQLRLIVGRFLMWLAWPGFAHARAHVEVPLRWEAHVCSRVVTKLEVMKQTNWVF